MKRILLNSFGKSILCLLLALLSGGTTWAAEEVYQLVKFGASFCTYSNNRVNNYTSSWTATYEGFQMDIVNFKNIGSDNVTYPTYISTGNTSATVIASVTTHTPIDAKITKVAVTFPELVGASINSIKLQISNNGSTWETVDNFPKEPEGTYEVTIPESMTAENLYYRIEADCARGSKTNFVKIEKIEFYQDNQTLVQAPVITGTHQVFTQNTEISIACPAPDTDATIEYSTDHGYNWHPYTVPFTLTETTTVLARASKTGMKTNQSSAVFTHINDAVNFDWNLATNSGVNPVSGVNSTPSVNSTDLVKWTSEDATMTLTKGMAAANNHLGGNNGNTYTEISKGQTLTITPAEDYTIQKVTITAPNATEATNGFSGRAWENATYSIEGQDVILTPTIGTEPISMSISNSVSAQVIGVTVDCSPASSPYVTATEDQTVISGESTGTFDIYYNRLESDNAIVIPCDASGNAATYDWIVFGFDVNKDVTYTVTAKNPNTTATRAAYFYVEVDEYQTHIIAVTQEAPIEVSISSVGYSTLYYGTRNLEVPEGVTATTYKVEEGKLTQSSTYSVIPAGSGVVLNAAQGKYYFYESLTADAKDTNNQLKGSDEAAETSGGNYYYALTLNAAKEPNSVGFYWMTTNGGKFTNGAHKAYLALDSMFAEPTSPVKSYFTLFDEDDPTGVNNLNVDDNLNNNIYNVAGQRISKMQKGINIINGKKILK